LLKVENSGRRQSRYMQGFSIVEILLVMCILGTLSGVIYQLFSRLGSQANNDDKSSKYFMSLGFFVEFLNNDLAMARAIHQESDGMSLLVNTDGTPGSITYKLKGNKIERSFRGTARVFEFPNPNQKESPLIFRIEEVKP